MIFNKTACIFFQLQRQKCMSSIRYTITDILIASLALSVDFTDCKSAFKFVSRACMILIKLTAMIIRNMSGFIFSVYLLPSGTKNFPWSYIVFNPRATPFIKRNIPLHDISGCCPGFSNMFCRRIMVVFTVIVIN